MPRRSQCVSSMPALRRAPRWEPQKILPSCRVLATSFVLGAKGRRQRRQEGSMSYAYPLIAPSSRSAERAAPASDTALIAATATGDKLALRTLYARHHVRVYRFLLRLVRNEAMAEDLVAEYSWTSGARLIGSPAARRSRLGCWPSRATRRSRRFAAL